MIDRLLGMLSCTGLLDLNQNKKIFFHGHWVVAFTLARGYPPSARWCANESTYATLVCLLNSAPAARTVWTLTPVGEAFRYVGTQVHYPFCLPTLTQ